MKLIKHPAVIVKAKNIKLLNILIEQYVKTDKKDVKRKILKEQS
jgi:hypothetical protein